MTDKEFKRIKQNKSWLVTFKHAFDGCIYAFRTQKNFKIHVIMSFSAIVLAMFLEISYFRWALLIFAIVFGFTIEMVNTAFEKTVDLVTEKYNPKAKVAKDVAAGAMLIASIGLFILGAFALVPSLWQKIFGF